MKYFLLSAALLATAPARAQWANQPINFAQGQNTAFYLDVVDANTVWTATEVLQGPDVPPQVARTANAGQTWAVSNVAGLGAGENVVGLAAVSSTTAWLLAVTSNGTGGRILRTTDGGQTWAAQGAGTAFQAPGSYPGVVRFFSATEGVAGGEATAAGGRFEFYTTANAGQTWTPVANAPVALPQERLIALPAAGVGPHIWVATSRGRVLHSPDRGLTWTVGTTGALHPTGLAFRDAQRGLLTVLDDNGTNHRLFRTQDGGATWTSVGYTGPLHGLGLSAVPGTNLFVSTGADLGNGDQGSSYSRNDGLSWISLETTTQHLAVELLGPGVGWSGGLARTNAGALLGNGVNRLANTALAAQPSAAAEAPLAVFPNPSPSGRFAVHLPPGQRGAEITVFDAVGRAFGRQPWEAGPALAQALDLSQAPAGVYVVAVRTAQGAVLRQKIVRP